MSTAAHPLRVLVTGGAGYFGQVLVEELRQQGHQVRIFDINRPTISSAEIEFIQGDIRDTRVVRQACLGVQLVFHNVAQVPLAKDRSAFWSVNRDGTRVLLDACFAERVSKVIYTSSSAVYGIPAHNPVTEATEPQPGEDYGRAKLEGERLCLEYAQQGGDATIVRPRTIMGHGRLGIFQILFEWIYEGRNVPVLGDGANVYQFVHASDLARLELLAANLPGTATFNCGADQFGTMREVLEGVCRHAGTGSRVVNLALRPAEIAMRVTSGLGLSPLGPYHSMMYGRSMFFDVTKAIRELGWRPQYSNNAMFIESYDWYCQHRSEVLRGDGNKSLHTSVVKQRLLGLLKYII